ncbi:non-functional NADPH-dependent codeinone reductase 2-like [Tripterygium wilfordii]|uniref:non-functional NADPH-dependent codeinone reductase 2-like n=1 Tax=Tripterygium wilfordii TaxID=458696 RepID=UPI0018F7EBD0|nr:non-functional NADPH-dependent codeinone reductase 2-like [Tripterygium wilfordii]
MASSQVPQVLLSSSGGHKMPLLGLGTATFPPVGPQATKSAILQAIELGYRHFDTASFYLTEQPIGEAIAEALSCGLIKSRDDLFITSKLWCNDGHPELVLPALKKSLENLKLEYLDLYLIHWPVSTKPGGSAKDRVRNREFLPMDYTSVWKAMEECQTFGLTKSIGVSNFSCTKLGYILATARIPPAVNEVEFKPLWQQKKLMEFCKANGVILTAYSVLGSTGTMWGNNRVMEDRVLNQIAEARGKSVAQVSLRWAYEQGVCALVKSFNKERMKENLNIFNWALTTEEAKKISEIEQVRGYLGEQFISIDGPFKTVEELWDGEV